MSTLATMLFPRPRSFELTGSASRFPDEITIQSDPDLPSQGFTISTNESQIQVRHNGSDGLRYANNALRALEKHPDYGKYHFEVVDYPDFERRGLMLDLSRDRVPNRATLLRFLDLAEAARVNQIELYTEHTFTWERHQIVWQDSSALTPADLRWLDGESYARGIELVPAVNCFGHMGRWLKHPEYAAKAEAPDGFSLAGVHQPPGTLEPTEENRDFVVDLILEISSYFRSDRVNIGGDEPFELGKGKSKDLVLKHGKGTVYLQYLEGVISKLVEAGKQVEFWADVFAAYPELVDNTPEGSIPVLWHYDSPAVATEVLLNATEDEVALWESEGLDADALKAGVGGRGRNLINRQVPFIVAPGTGSWLSFTGRLTNGIENMLDAAVVGCANDCVGYLITSWGDAGSFDPPAFTFAPFLFGAAMAWNHEANSDIDLVSLVNSVVTLDPTGLSGAALVNAGYATDLLKAPVMNSSPLFTILANGRGPAEHNWPKPAAVRSAADLLRTCRVSLNGAKPACSDAQILIDEARTAIDWALFGASILELGPAGVKTLSEIEALAKLTEFDRLIQSSRACWNARNETGGLDDAMSHFQDLRRELVVRSVGQ